MLPSPTWGGRAARPQGSRRGQRHERDWGDLRHTYDIRHIQSDQPTIFLRRWGWGWGSRGTMTMTITMTMNQPLPGRDGSEHQAIRERTAKFRLLFFTACLFPAHSHLYPGRSIPSRGTRPGQTPADRPGLRSIAGMGWAVRMVTLTTYSRCSSTVTLCRYLLGISVCVCVYLVCGLIHLSRDCLLAPRTS